MGNRGNCFYLVKEMSVLKTHNIILKSYSQLKY